jgi:zinc and cadmium transporter
MTVLFYIIVSCLFISLFALVGVFTISLSGKFLQKILMNLVSLSSGALLGGAFLHLMPEGVKKLPAEKFFMIVLAAILVNWFIEKILHWRHCHKGVDCETHHTMGYMNLIGDSVHNFIDGLIIASAFIAGNPMGWATVMAVALHEIPQEIGDFGVLLHSGFSKKKALVSNFLVALTVVLGGFVGWLLAQRIEGIVSYLLPIAAGGFLYIASSDLLPEIRKTKTMGKFMINFLFLIIGIGLMYLVKFLGVE